LQCPKLQEERSGIVEKKIAGVPRKRRLGNIYRLAGRQIPIVDWNQNAAKMQAELLRPD
jgi:hypothetical protein